MDKTDVVLPMQERTFPQVLEITFSDQNGDMITMDETFVLTITVYDDAD